jgi:hypothetical protein
LVTTGPDFMHPMYTRGFELCRSRIDLVIPIERVLILVRYYTGSIKVKKKKKDLVLAYQC